MSKSNYLSDRGDFYNKSFNQAQYKSQIEIIESGSSRYLLATDEGFQKASLLRRIFEGIRGFFGFQNRVDSARVSADILKLLYYGETQGYLKAPEIKEIVSKIKEAALAKRSKQIDKVVAAFIENLQSETSSPEIRMEKLQKSISDYHSRENNKLRPSLFTRIFSKSIPPLTSQSQFGETYLQLAKRSMEKKPGEPKSEKQLGRIYSYLESAIHTQNKTKAFQNSTGDLFLKFLRKTGMPNSPLLSDKAHKIFASLFKTAFENDDMDSARKYVDFFARTGGVKEHKALYEGFREAAETSHFKNAAALFLEHLEAKGIPQEDSLQGEINQTINLFIKKLIDSGDFETAQKSTISFLKKLILNPDLRGLIKILAEKQIEKKEFEKALPLLREALRRYQNDSQIKATVSDIARKQLHEGPLAQDDLTFAKNLSMEALGAFPDDLGLMSLKTIAQVCLKEYEAAYSNLHKILEEDIGSPIILFRIVESYKLKKDFAAIDHIFPLFKTKGEAYENLETRPKWALCEAHIAVDLAHFHLNKQGILLPDPDFPKALQYLERAYELNPEKYKDLLHETYLKVWNNEKSSWNLFSKKTEGKNHPLVRAYEVNPEAFSQVHVHDLINFYDNREKFEEALSLHQKAKIKWPQAQFKPSAPQKWVNTLLEQAKKEPSLEQKDKILKEAEALSKNDKTIAEALFKNAVFLADEFENRCTVDLHAKENLSKVDQKRCAPDALNAILWLDRAIERNEKNRQFDGIMTDKTPRNLASARLHFRKGELIDFFELEGKRALESYEKAAKGNPKNPFYLKRLAEVNESGDRAYEDYAWSGFGTDYLHWWDDRFQKTKQNLNPNHPHL